MTVKEHMKSTKMSVIRAPISRAMKQLNNCPPDYESLNATATETFVLGTVLHQIIDFDFNYRIQKRQQGFTWSCFVTLTDGILSRLYPLAVLPVNIEAITTEIVQQASI
jgi:hypothetical protein